MAGIILLAAGSLIASGVIFRHQRLLTYLAAAGVLFEGQWLLLTLLDRTVLQQTPSRIVYGIGAAAILTGWTLWFREWTFPYLAAPGSGRRDLAVLLVLMITLTASWLVTSSNGWHNGSWITHGFYNGDTATLSALVQRSLLTDSLVTVNPFAAGHPLEYPVLLHAALAGFLTMAGLDGNGWLHFLPVITMVQVTLTVPMFFLLWDTVYPEPEERWRRWLGVNSRRVILGSQALIVLLVMALSWDNYIYPQSHFFLTGLFLLEIMLFLRGRVRWGSAAAALLMLSNAVTGTAAVAVAAVYYLLSAADRKKSAQQRLAYLGGVAVWAALLLMFTPGEPSFSLTPHLSYTAAPAMLRLGPTLVLLAAASWLEAERQSLLSAGAAVLAAMAFVVFFFSSRNIVVENSERFIYHALLLAFPLFIGPLIRLYYSLRRWFVYTAKPLGATAAGWTLLLVVVLAAVLPAAASVASAHDNLMFKDERKTDLFYLEAMDWINDHLPREAVVLASPEAPWAVPVFTGQPLLRTDFWLSPADDTLTHVKKALAGNRLSQQKVATRADYLLLTDNEQAWWDTSSYERIFVNSKVAIYRF